MTFSAIKNFVRQQLASRYVELAATDHLPTREPERREEGGFQVHLLSWGQKVQVRKQILKSILANAVNVATLPKCIAWYTRTGVAVFI